MQSWMEWPGRRKEMQDQGQYQVHSVGVVGAHSHCILSSAKETTRDMRERRRESIFLKVYRVYSSLMELCVCYSLIICAYPVYREKNCLEPNPRFNPDRDNNN